MREVEFGNGAIFGRARCYSLTPKLKGILLRAGDSSRVQSRGGNQYFRYIVPFGLKSPGLEVIVGGIS